MKLKTKKGSGKHEGGKVTTCGVLNGAEALKAAEEEPSILELKREKREYEGWEEKVESVKEASEFLD